MPRECPCEVALLEHIPTRAIVWLISSHYHRDDRAIIDELVGYKSLNGVPSATGYDQLTAREKNMAWIREDDISRFEWLLDGRLADRWIFEVDANDSIYMRFLGKVSGNPSNLQSSQCIITVANGRIIIEIDKVHIDVDVRGEFGSSYGTPFMRSRRSKLRTQMYNLQYLPPEDMQHRLFDKMCDLAHETIWNWIH
jgi:hypothetical protein